MFWNYSHGTFGFIILNVILFILDCVKTDHVAKQACSAYLLSECYEIGTLIQHFMYLFLLSDQHFVVFIIVFWLVTHKQKKLW